jgi:undecaprenyl-diphosphatase
VKTRTIASRHYAAGAALLRLAQEDREKAPQQNLVLPPLPTGFLRKQPAYLTAMPATSLPSAAAVAIRPRSLWLPAALAWGTFSTMAALVFSRGRAPFDNPSLLALHRHATPALDGLAEWLTIVGNTGPMVAAGILTTAALARRGRRREAWLFALGVGGSMLLTQVIKRIAARPRPDLWPSIRPEHTFSFPSGHAMDTAALAAALFFITPPHRRKWWALAPLFALSVGWARMYLGVHFPSDVLAGWSSGAGWVLLVQLWAARTSPPSPLSRGEGEPDIRIENESEAN